MLRNFISFFPSPRLVSFFFEHTHFHDMIVPYPIYCCELNIHNRVFGVGWSGGWVS